MRYTRLLISCLLVLFGSVSAPLIQAEPHQQPPSPTPMAAVDLGPDRCERNNRPEQACVLTIDSVNGPYSFIPRGDQDYYSVDLGSEPTGLTTEIMVRGTDGLDLRTSITPAGTNTPIATISSPAISATLPISLTGWFVIRVENRSPKLANWETYGIEIRQQLPPAPTAPISAHPGAPQKLPPDILEDNYDIDHAAPVAVGTVYDLSFTCPATWSGACMGGDHDYITFATKAKHRYLIATFDLQTTDTVIDLFWGDRHTPLATNDDAYGPDEARRIPGGFASVIRWVAPADGWAIVRIGPRTGGTAPIVANEKAGAYRFAVALAGSALATQIEQRLAEQAGVPTPTPAPVKAPAAGGSSGTTNSGTNNPAPAPNPGSNTTTMSSDVRPGPAVVQAAASKLYTNPDPHSQVLQEVPQETRVQLKGQISGVWVRVEVDGGIAPGWMDSRHLRRLDEPNSAATSPTPVEGENSEVLPPGISDPAEGTPAIATTTSAVPAKGQAVRVTSRGPAPTPTPRAATVPQEARFITIQICTGTGSTTTCTTPLRGVHAELLHAATRAVLIGGRTDTNGELRLPAPPYGSVLLHLPTLGVLVPLQPTDTTVPIRIPEGATP